MELLAYKNFVSFFGPTLYIGDAFCRTLQCSLCRRDVSV